MERTHEEATQALIGFHLKNPLEGYRRLMFMMLDADIVAVSPASVWRVLSQAGLLRKWNGKPSKKGTGFEQPPEPHQHWHIDVSYLNITVPLHSATGYVTPMDTLAGRQAEIHAAHDRKLEEDRRQRQLRRQHAASAAELNTAS